jgi:hypothetical protein
MPSAEYSTIPNGTAMRACPCRHIPKEDSMLRKLVTLGLATAAPLAIVTPSQAQAADGIHVYGASYGLPGQVIQVTGLVRDRCEGRWRCSFPVRNDFFGGDPVIGVTKQVVVYWDCGDGRNRSAFREWGRAYLQCD